MFSKFELCDHLNSSGQTFMDGQRMHGQPSQKHPHSDGQIYQGDYWYVNSWSSVIREKREKLSHLWDIYYESWDVSLRKKGIKLFDLLDLYESWDGCVICELWEFSELWELLNQLFSLREEINLAEKLRKKEKYALRAERLNRFLDEEEIHSRVGCLETETPFLVEDGVVVSDFGPDLVQVSEPQTVSGTSLNVSELDLPPAPLVDPCTAGRTVKDARHDDVARVGSVIILSDSEAPLPHRDPCIAGCIGEDASHSDVDWMGSATTLNDSEVDLPPARLVNHWTVGLICGDLDWGLLRSQAAGMLQSLLTVFCKDMKEQSYFDCKVNSFPFDPGGF